jgi:ribonuclease VapC
VASVVLDSSAILAVLNAEPGAQVVAAALNHALISAVNYAEVVGKLIERGSSYALALSALTAIALNVADFDLALAQRAGELRAETRKRGLSLGDRACLSLAEREGIPAITADRSWVGAVSGVEVQLFR